MTTRNRIVTAEIIAVAISAAVFLQHQFSALQKQAEPEQFTVPLSDPGNQGENTGNNSRGITARLKAEGFIRNTWALNIALGLNPFSQCADCIMPGAYKISTSMSVWKMAGVLKQAPYMRWVVIPEGWRKEQIAELLADTLGWDRKDVKKFITIDTQTTPDSQEGVYFPDTYLIPTDESTAAVAERLRVKFNEAFAPYARKALGQNIRWPTLLKIASVVQREAAGTDDMPFIAGILWNRLLNNQKLEVDATVQYARDTAYETYVEENGWWRPIRPEDKTIDSPYNTYLYKGLPPHPIANPGLDAIGAALNPEETECLFYLHDHNRQIHCAKTYEEHLQNIEIFLKMQ